MDTGKRRQKIIETLKNSENSIKGTALAEKFNVSRQVIVQDIAVLRAKGFEIIGTPVGYMINRQDSEKLTKTIATKHLNIDQVKEELMIIIDNGGTIIDVIVDHPVYGNVQGILNLNYRGQVDKFLDRIRSGKAEFLSSLTEGIHRHTIEVPTEEDFIKIKKQLKEKGYLVDEQ